LIKAKNIQTLKTIANNKQEIIINKYIQALKIYSSIENGKQSRKIKGIFK
jgi:hypothetical protein